MHSREFYRRLNYYRRKFPLDTLAQHLGVTVEDIVCQCMGENLCDARFQLAVDQLAALNVKAKIDAK